MMKISFPYMGNTIIYKKLLELLGHNVIMPPVPNQETINLGVKYSPEFACFPLKVIMGSYLQTIENGADTIVTSGGHGPCRAGFYEKVHSKILEAEGYNVDFIVFDSLFKNKKAFNKFMSNLKKLKSSNSWFKVISSVNIVYNMTKKLDKLEKRVQKIRAYEVNKGETSAKWFEIQKIFDKAMNKIELDKAYKKSEKILNNIKVVEVEEDRKIKIGIIGEIYVVMESSINMKIEENLGKLGCEVERSQYLSDWITYNALSKFKFLNRTHEAKILKKGEEYLPINIGGHAKQNMGHIVDFKERGFDGVVHLMPFGCLPELVNQSIIPSIYEKLDIPVLTLSLDEQTGIANNQTRVEAFIDLIRNKKENKKRSRYIS